MLCRMKPKEYERRVLMKKILALLLALAMVLSLAACSNSGAKDSQKPAEESKEPAAVTAMRSPSSPTWAS